jgi:hypothetical protein
MQRVQNAIQRPPEGTAPNALRRDSVVLPFQPGKSAREYVLLGFMVSLITGQVFPSEWARGQINAVHIPGLGRWRDRDTGTLWNLGTLTGSAEFLAQPRFGSGPRRPGLLDTPFVPP